MIKEVILISKLPNEDAEGFDCIRRPCRNRPIVIGNRGAACIIHILYANDFPSDPGLTYRDPWGGIRYQCTICKMVGKRDRICSQGGRGLLYCPNYRDGMEKVERPPLVRLVVKRKRRLHL